MILSLKGFDGIEKSKIYKCSMLVLLYELHILCVKYCMHNMIVEMMNRRSLLGNKIQKYIQMGHVLFFIVVISKFGVFNPRKWPSIGPLIF